MTPDATIAAIDGATSPDSMRYRARVRAMPAYTPTGWGWFYEILDMSAPIGRSCVMSGARWTWAEALSEALFDLHRRQRARVRRRR